MHSARPLLSLIIPTLNERAALPILYDRLLVVATTLNERGMESELIFVDDGSTDGTRETIKRLTKQQLPVRLIERTTRGLATAVVTGLNAAHGTMLGVMDADLSHPPELIPSLVEALASHELVVASRHLPGGGGEEWPWHRKLFSDMATAVAQPLARSCTDPMSGFFFMRRSVIETVKLKPVGYKILLEILVKGHFKTLTEIPYLFHNRNYGKSKLNGKVTLEYFWHLILLYSWKYTTSLH